MDLKLTWGEQRSVPFLDPCAELVDSHELFILCDLMGDTTAHLLGYN